MCIKYKEDILPMLVFCTSIFLSIANCETAIVCPNVSIEKGSSHVIFCQSDHAISYYYWYRGYSNSTPILILDNQGKAGAEFGSKNFDISSNGSMILKNVLVEHESYYSFVGYDQNRRVGEAKFFVNVTISPDPPCPLIHGCNSCIECDFFDLKKTGTLTCEVKGARPLVPLVWNITSKKRIDFVRHHPKEDRNLGSDSWDTSVSLDYTIEDPCGVLGEVKCVAEDPAHILQSRITTVNIKIDHCNALPVYGTSPSVISPTSPSEVSSLAAVVAILVAVFMVLLIGFIGFIAIYKCRRNRNAGQIVRLLKDGYKQFCYLKPLPWGEDIHIAALYTDNNCTVTDKEEMPGISSDELRTPKSILSQRLVIFMGEHGDGRTTFLKQFVYEWIEGMKDIFLLIFVPLKDVKADKKLSKFLVEDILKTSKFKTGHVEAILKDKDKHCLVILDGLEDLPESFRNGMGDTGNQAEDTGNLVTIGGLIQGKPHRKYSNLHVWISSREADCESSWCPTDFVKVVMERFSKDQLTKYVRKCCVYYVSYIQGEERKEVTYVPSKDSTSEVTFQQEETTEEIDDVFNKVQNFLEENNVVRDYENAPLLINLMVHILAAHYSTPCSYLNDVEINNMTSLLRVVICCMKERYVIKNPSFSTKDFNDLAKKLGEIALQERENLADKNSKFWVEQIGDEKNVKTACQIGLLKLTKECPTSAKVFAVEFHHERIQDFLAAFYILNTGERISDYERILEQCGEDKRERIKRIFQLVKYKIQF